MAEPERLFSVEQANHLLPALTEVLERIRAQLGLATDPAVSGRLRSRAGHNGGGPEASQMLGAGRRLERQLAFLDRHGVLLRDPQEGLVDFPSRLRGEPVFLCWRLGEPEVGFWHPRDRGFSDRRPL